MLPLVGHWINGRISAPEGAKLAPVYDPALGVQTKSVTLADESAVSWAIDAAKAAFPEWRDQSLARRAAIMFRFRELLNERKGELAEIITGEHGKVLSDALGEITPRSRSSGVCHRHPAPPQGFLQ